MKTARRLVARKLLVAAVGVASVSYVEGCGKTDQKTTDPGPPPTAGNLASEPVEVDAGAASVAPPDGSDAAVTQDAAIDAAPRHDAGKPAPRKPPPAVRKPPKGFDPTSGNLMAP